jgi:hypothetical protein
MIKRRGEGQPRNVHLNPICMSYDQKKGCRSTSQCSWPNLHELWSKEGYSQIDNSILDHKSLERRGQWNLIGACYTPLKKYFEGAIRYNPHIFKIILIWENYECPKFWDNKSFNFGTFIWGSRGKVTFQCNPMVRHKLYYREGTGAFSQRLWAGKACACGCPY